MTDFGEVLRKRRQSCREPQNPRRPLSQGRLGELLGNELNMQGGGYSAAAISDWELGKSKISADQRLVLMSLIKILHQFGGLESSAESDDLLEAGNYRALNPDEKRKIFPKELHTTASEVPTYKSGSQQGELNFRWAEKFSQWFDELQMLINEAEEGPPPSWPRVVASLLRKFTDSWSISRILIALMWIWAELLAWLLIAPSLRLPYLSREGAEVALKAYVGGTFAIPLLIGALTNTKWNKFWQERNLASDNVTRLYTYQGAGVGFHVGYFGIFAINLMGYYLHLHVARWIELVEIAIILLWGYIGARVVPHNLLRAFKRLDLADGWVFFVFFLVGPFWGFFFFEFYSVFLASATGGLLILFAISLLILKAAWDHYHPAVRSLLRKSLSRVWHKE